MSDQAAIDEAAYIHFRSILGSEHKRSSTIDLDSLDPRSFDLHALETPFSEHEI